ncbi:MAG: orotidine-5'-phosphate decarboxylase [Deltaproteobacteria bacterium]|nr:orotidine-5'-phosphate decarboxylase [Deltaproteobacteria bacterium]
MQHKDIPLNERIIFALDVNSKQEAEKWLNKLGDHIKFYKVGLQLFISEWFSVIDIIAQRGCKVMCDLKLFDIPETVKLAVTGLKDKNIEFLTVHGNDPIIRAAVEVKEKMKILAVTVLTSFDEKDMVSMGLKGSIEDLVYKRAKRAIDIGCDGIISSGLEVPKLRQDLGDNFVVVTPGIRPGKNDYDDQKRVATPAQVIKNGADYLVIGRAISRSKNPVDTVKQIQDDINNALSKPAA